MNKTTITLSVLAGVILWVGIGIVAGGYHNAYSRAWLPELYQSKYQAESEQEFSYVWGATGGPISFVIQWGMEGHKDGWTLTGKPLPCTEKEQYAKDIWCKGNE